MPNWCANRLRISGNSSNIERVRTLFAGDGSPAYARATAEGIQLFLAGCAGVLRPVTDMQYTAYPALILHSGSDTPENRAFAQWLAYLKGGAELTEDNCRVLHALWLACSISSWPWEMLSDEQHAVITALWVQKAGDWRAAFGSDSLPEAWNRLCREDYEPAEAPPFDCCSWYLPALMWKLTAITVVCLKAYRTAFRKLPSDAAQNGHTRMASSWRTRPAPPLTPILIRHGRLRARPYLKYSVTVTVSPLSTGMLNPVVITAAMQPTAVACRQRHVAIRWSGVE